MRIDLKTTTQIGVNQLTYAQLLGALQHAHKTYSIFPGSLTGSRDTLAKAAIRVKAILDDLEARTSNYASPHLKFQAVLVPTDLNKDTMTLGVFNTREDAARECYRQSIKGASYYTGTVDLTP